MKDFYGTEIQELKLIDGTLAKLGDLVQWHTWDSEENTTWSFMGIYKSDHVVYLGGGIDFGMGIGRKITIYEVIDDSYNNDEWYRGVKKIGEASDVPRALKSLNKGE